MVRPFHLFLGALVFASPLTFAATYDLGPSEFERLSSGSVVKDGDRLRTSYGQSFNLRNGPTIPVTRNVSASVPAVTNTLKGLVRSSPASLAATAAISTLFVGLDWLFDPDNQTWKKMGEDVYDDLEFGLWSYCSGATCATGPTPQDTCNAVSQVFGVNASQVELLSSTSGRCRNPQNQLIMANITKTGQCPENYIYRPSEGICVLEGEYIPLSETDIAELDTAVPSQPTNTLRGIAVETGDIAGPGSIDFGDDPITGPNPFEAPGPSSTSTGPDGVTVTSTTNNFHFDYGTTSVTHTHTNSTTTTHVNGNPQPSETVTTETPAPSGTLTPSGEPTVNVEVDMPTDCDLIPTVCAWLEWFKTPFEPPAEEPLVIEDQDFEQDFTFTLAASCPPPYTINLVLFGPLQFHWDPFCDFAVMIRPLVVASAALFAAFIVLGIGRGRG